MGMYDCLGEEQIKIFYFPIYNSKYADGENPIWYSGGSLRIFNKEDDLPLKTLYYKYPNNFIIYDYKCGDKYNVCIIKDGHFKESRNINELKTEDLLPVFDYYGEELNISKVEDFINIYNDFKVVNNEKKTIEKKFFKKGVFFSIKNESSYYDSVKDDFHKELEKINKQFSDRWLINDKYSKEKQFGELLYCFSKGDNSTKEGCLNEIQNLVTADKDIVEKYSKWAEFDEIRKEFLLLFIYFLRKQYNKS